MNPPFKEFLILCKYIKPKPFHTRQQIPVNLMKKNLILAIKKLRNNFLGYIKCCFLVTVVSQILEHDKLKFP